MKKICMANMATYSIKKSTRTCLVGRDAEILPRKSPCGSQKAFVQHKATFKKHVIRMKTCMEI